MSKTRSVPYLLCLAIAAALPAAASAQPAQQPSGARPAAGAAPQPSPEQAAAQKASEQDRQLMLHQLHITSLRPPVDARAKSGPHIANYDQSTADRYPKLPALLVLKNGKKVTTADMWWKQPIAPGSSAVSQGYEGPAWQELTLAKGWGIAYLNPASIQADNGAGLTKGIIGLVNKGEPRKPDDWGQLRALGWGASRAMDYFETDKAVDAKRVAIHGHSRGGKAAVVAMAYEPRIATGFISSSGEGGVKLHRRNYGEIVDNLAATNEYHWMAGNFLKYAGPLTWNDLPVDAHELLALCAPRPVFIGAGNLVDPAYDIGNSDAWADAKGMFMAAVAAEPIYKLLGKKGFGANVFPPIETTLIDGDIGFRQHTGGHTPGPNWPAFLAFADRQFKAIH